MIRCECAIDEASPDCPMHGDGEHPVMPPEQCRPVEVDGEIVRVRGEREMNDADRAALAEVVAAAKRHLAEQGISGDIRRLAIVHQPFDGQGNLVCLECRDPIQHGQFWIEVRQRDETDSDARLAVHIGCLASFAISRG